MAMQWTTLSWTQLTRSIQVNRGMRAQFNYIVNSGWVTVTTAVWLRSIAIELTVCSIRGDSDNARVTRRIQVKNVAEADPTPSLLPATVPPRNANIPLPWLLRTAKLCWRRKSCHGYCLPWLVRRAIQCHGWCEVVFIWRIIFEYPTIAYKSIGIAKYIFIKTLVLSQKFAFIWGFLWSLFESPTRTLALLFVFAWNTDLKVLGVG